MLSNALVSFKLMEWVFKKDVIKKECRLKRKQLSELCMCFVNFFCPKTVNKNT